VETDGGSLGLFLKACWAHQGLQSAGSNHELMYKHFREFFANDKLIVA
jgi:hypothetical protein